MEVLSFIFLLGIHFSIFGFIWALIMFVIRSLQGSGQANEASTYIFRIVKYFLLVSVTANLIAIDEKGVLNENVEMMSIVLGSVVLGLYLLGKLQNRVMLNQFSQNPMFAKFMPKVDPKVERFLLIGSVVYFIACLSYPHMVNNPINNWFASAIRGIYDTPIIGGIFSIIAFFFLISILLRGANVIGRILNGQSITEPPKMTSNFKFRGGGTPFDDIEEKHEDDEGFADYEDVTDVEDSDKNEKD